MGDVNLPSRTDPARSDSGESPGFADRSRVSIFVADLSATGVVRNAVAIANRLATEGHRVDLVTCRAEGPLAADIAPDIAVHALLGNRPRRARPLDLAAGLGAYRRLLDRSSPDVLLSAGNHAHLFCWAAWRASPNARRVYRISNDLSHSGARTMGLARLFRAAQLRLIARDADRLVLVAASLLDNASVAAAARAERTRIISNGVDTTKVRVRAADPCPHPWLQPGEAPTVLAAGRLVRQKNFETLLEALAIARRAMPLRLVILGGGSDKARARLLARIDELALSDAVDLAPPVDNPFPWMRAAAAFVLPSLWEGASNVLLEAMACGTPVVVSRTAGNAAEVLDGGRYGRLVDPADPAGLAKALLTQAGDDPLSPGNRALHYDRRIALDAYADIVATLTDRAIEPASETEPRRDQHGVAALVPERLGAA